MRLKNELKKVMLYGGLDKEEFKKVQDSITDKNRKMLYITGAICMILFIGMFISTFFSAKTDLMNNLRLRSRFVYAMLIIVCGIAVIMGERSRHRYNRFVIVEWYIFLSILFGFAIWAGTYNQPYNPSITFFVFLFALPLLIIERPIRLCFYMMAVSFFFLFCSFQTKGTDLFELDLLNCFCFFYLSIALSMIMMILKYKEALHKIEIEEQRDKDGLTELLNKAAIEREVCKCLKTEEKGFLIIIDIDDFKYINDHYGHLFGDAVLCAYAKCFKEVFQDSSLLGRFGGDEFIAYIKKESFDDIVQLFNKGRKILKTMIDFPIYEGMMLTMIAGAAFFNGNGQDYKKLLELADQALYEAKQNGKNQIKLYKKDRKQ